MLATVNLKSGGTLTLGDDWEWSGDGADKANWASVDYSYSPADGQPGAVLAAIVADKLGGGRVVLPKLDPPQSGEIN